MNNYKEIENLTCNHCELQSGLYYHLLVCSEGGACYEE